MLKRFWTEYIRHTLFKNTIIYTTTNILTRAIPFLLLPVLTRFLTPADYGIVATSQVLLAIGVVFIGLNMHGVLSVNFFRLERKDLNVHTANILFIECISFITILLTAFIFKVYVAQIAKFPENWFPLIIFMSFCQSLSLVLLTLWQAEQKAFPYSIFQILQTILNITFSILFVVVFVWKWQGRLLAIMVTLTIFGFLSIFILLKRNYLTFKINTTAIKEALFFGIPLIPHALGSWIIASIDRLFINNMVNISATGIYTIGYQVGMIIGLLATSFNQTWAPFLFGKLKENRIAAKLKIVRFTYLYFVVIISLALLLSLIAPYFLRFFVGQNFQLAYRYVIWIALGYAAEGMYFMVVNYIFYVKKTYILAWITLATALINIFLNYHFIQMNGPIGAAQATTITFFISFIFTWILSAKVYKMPWFSLFPSKKS